MPRSQSIHCAKNQNQSLYKRLGSTSSEISAEQNKNLHLELKTNKGNKGKKGYHQQNHKILEEREEEEGPHPNLIMTLRDMH